MKKFKIFKFGITIFILLFIGFFGIYKRDVKINAATIDPRNWDMTTNTFSDYASYVGGEYYISYDDMMILWNGLYIVYPAEAYVSNVEFWAGGGEPFSGGTYYELDVSFTNNTEFKYSYFSANLCPSLTFKLGGINSFYQSNIERYVWLGSSEDFADLSLMPIPEDTVSPVIDTEKYIYITNVNNPTTIENMMSAVQLRAYDEIDGDLTDLIEIVSDGGYNDKVRNKSTVKDRLLGDYAINFRVSDNAGNVATCTITIRVVDTTVPTISESSILTYDIGYSGTPISHQTFMDGIIANDNHSKTLNKTIVTDNYTENADKVGTYTVTVKVTDNSGNFTTVTITVSVFDNVAPVFSGSNTFYKSYDVPKSINDIINFCDIVANDEYDGEIDLQIVTDNYTGKANVPGIYTVLLRATDTRGNKSEFTLTITVGDDVVPFFLINKSKVIIEAGINMQSTQLIKVLKDNKVIDDKSLSFTVINDTYSGNESNPGLYNYDLKILYENGVEDYVELEVEVLEESTDNPIEVKGPSFFDKVWDWIVQAVKTIWKWIKILWSWLKKLLELIVKLFK